MDIHFLTKEYFLQKAKYYFSKNENGHKRLKLFYKKLNINY